MDVRVVIMTVNGKQRKILVTWYKLMFVVCCKRDSKSGLLMFLSTVYNEKRNESNSSVAANFEYVVVSI